MCRTQWAAVGTAGFLNFYRKEVHMAKRYTDKSGNARDLTEKQRNFCYNVASGETLFDSYIKAGYRLEGKRATAQAKASHLFAMPHIQDFIKELREQNASLSIWTRDETLKKLKKIADDALEAAQPVMRDRDGEACRDENGKIIRGYDPPSATVALKAIQQAATMCGFNAPIETEQKVIIEMPDVMKEWAK